MLETVVGDSFEPGHSFTGADGKNTDFSAGVGLELIDEQPAVLIDLKRI